MAVVFPPYTPGGGGGGGGVASVNGDVGPAVLLDAADVGAATPADLSAGLATKANTTTVNAALATKVDRPANAPGQQNRVILFDAAGTGQTNANAVTTASQGAIPLRTTGGHIILPGTDPTNAAWAASKGYVDARVTELDNRLDALEQGAVMSDGTVTDIVARTQAEFDGITTKDPTTHYLIDG